MLDGGSADTAGGAYFSLVDWAMTMLPMTVASTAPDRTVLVQAWRRLTLIGALAFVMAVVVLSKSKAGWAGFDEEPPGILDRAILPNPL